MRLTLVLIVLAALGSSAPVSAQGGPGLPAEPFKIVDDLVARNRLSNATTGASELGRAKVR